MSPDAIALLPEPGTPIAICTDGQTHEGQSRGIGRGREDIPLGDYVRLAHILPPGSEVTVHEGDATAFGLGKEQRSGQVGRKETRATMEGAVTGTRQDDLVDDGGGSVVSGGR